MNELVKVKAYYIVRRLSTQDSLTIYAGPFDYYTAMNKREEFSNEDAYFYEIIYTDIVAELLL